ncbi:MAG: hypothetical protein HYV42_01045 [Candidatus Magasanikbacteria bacterium]|nr:hypothetical protein [Candidatus Magasanikbacteria bacterium]
MKKLLLLLAALAAFIILNPYGGLDILAGLVVIGLLLYHLVGDYAILALIAIRPTVDLWRDYIVVSTEEFTVNLNAALSLLLALWAIYFLVKEYQRRKNLPGKYLLIIFIAWSMATLIWSVDRLSTVTETLKIFNLGALFAIGFILSRRDGARFLAKLTPALALGSIPPLATALYQLATGGGQTIDEIPGRLFGTLAHPNVLAFLGLTLIFLLAHQSLQKQAPPPLFPQPVTRLALGILLAITLFTYTRVAWLGAVIFFALLAAPLQPLAR